VFGGQAGPERGISEINVFNPLFRKFGAAIGIGVVDFGEFLVAGFDGAEGDGPGEAEFGERGAQIFGNFGGAGGRGFVAFAGQAFESFAEDFRVDCRAAEMAEFPRWALPVGIGAEMDFDLRGAHTFVKIPGGVVCSDMVEAQPHIVAQVFAGSGSSIEAFLGAAVHGAGFAARGIRVGVIGPGAVGAFVHVLLCAAAHVRGKTRFWILGRVIFDEGFCYGRTRTYA